MQSTGLLAADAVDKALTALRRFRALCDRIEVEKVWVLATAACRDAKNGKAFIVQAQRICRTDIDVISGKREAELSSLGVVSGFHHPDGIVGDLGGGSLELIDIHWHRVDPGVTFPLGGLALQDASGKVDQEGREDRQEGLERRAPAQERQGPHLLRHRRHLAVARAAAHVADGLSAARDARLCHSGRRKPRTSAGLVHRVDPETLSQIEVVSDARRSLLPYAALVLEHVIEQARPKDIVISALGVREGLLYSLLHADERRKDPLLAAPPS